MGNAFEDLIDTLQEDVEKQALRNLGAKYKEVKDGYLRQSDYSKSMNSLAEDKKKFDSERQEKQAELDKLEDWKTWRVNNWDDGEGMTKSEVKKFQQIQDLNSELELLKQAQEAGMTFEEVEQYIDKELTKKGLVSREYLDKDFRKDLVDQATYRKDLDAKIATVANGLDYLYSSTLPVVLKHKDEFGEIIPPTEIIKYANENGISKIEDAYERMVAPRRAEAATKVTEKAIKEAEERGRQAAMKEKSMGQNGQVPVDNGPPVMGHLEKRLRMTRDKKTDEIPEDAPLGTRSNMIAEKYRREKAEGLTDKVIAEYGRPA